jgi:hypothetical protein
LISIFQVQMGKMMAKKLKKKILMYKNYVN